ncbi:acyl-CoA thioesterase [Collimonas silvisoli]|uniref:acyl-CoA thioesterase n=1 Tax=Collimonas silvisoli TaxID=2825884 RepID=UPI001B8B796D|nr:acyl-CoA thioesterase [Collimonas silvisoli]
MSAILSQHPVTKENEVEAIPFPLVYLRPRQAKTFRHSIDVYLKDSNATGNIYFARHFEWQGICRERWFFECISADMLQSLGVFITKEAQQQYVCETFAFQKIECEVNTFAIKQCSFSLSFRFLVDGKLVATGHQQIVFANKEKKISRLPEHILEKIREYEIDKAE